MEKVGRKGFKVDFDTFLSSWARSTAASIPV